jgi:ribosome-binding protein aMBF1 (putative translation factor)
VFDMSTLVVGVNDAGLRVGQDHHNAKLTDTEVRLLLELREAGWSYNRLAEKFEISKRHVRNICSGKKRGQLAVKFRVVRLPE